MSRFSTPLYLGIIILGIMLSAHIFLQEAQATKYSMIDVLLSESCNKLNHYNMTSSCPTIPKLIPFDTSNQFLSGHFVNNHGIWERTKPQVANHYVWYQNYSKPIVCIECKADLGNPDLVKIIFIEPSGFTFISKTQEIVNNGTRSEYNDRYMAGCDTATIAWNPLLLNDTISYLQNGCTHTNYNGTKIIPMKQIIPKYDGYSYKMQAWYGQAKHVTQNCITKKCTPLKDPNSKW